jgi:DNA repair protein RadC
LLVKQYPTLSKLYSAAASSKHMQQPQWPFIQLQASHTLCQRLYHEELIHLPSITSPTSLYDFLLSQFCNHTIESFACLFLNAQHQLIQFEHLSQGTINTTVVYPREIVKRALELNSCSIIAAHNHPSGNTEPSQADIALTQRIQQALDLFDINLLDHIIVGVGSILSLLHHGLLNNR